MKRRDPSVLNKLRLECQDPHWPAKNIPSGVVSLTFKSKTVRFSNRSAIPQLFEIKEIF